MTLDQLQSLAQAGVTISITAADLLSVVQAVSTRTDKPEQPLNLAGACVAYGRDKKTLRKYIEQGLIRGRKIGGEWEIETPAQRDRRMYNN